MTEHSTNVPSGNSRVWGSALIIAGTSIGAGMLAMPLTSAGMGFGLTALALLSMWALSTYTALQYAELYKHHPASDGLASLAGHYFGPLGKGVVTIILLLFMYAIAAAYISGGGSLLGGMFGLTGVSGSVLYALLIAAVVLLGTATVDTLTRVLFTLKLLAFGVILAFVLPHLNADYLPTAPQHATLYFSALPIFFTSFGFHVIIPSVAEYVGGDTRALRRAILWGTGIPLAVYLVWQLAIHGLLPQSQLLTIRSLDELSAAIGVITGSAVLGIGVQVFSALALTTSVLGVGLALLHSLRDVLGNRLGHLGQYAKGTKLNTAATALLAVLTFVPPTLLATLYPQGFVALLGYAGLLAVLYTVLLPGLLVLRARHIRPHPQDLRLLGGRAFIWLGLLLGAAILFIPLLIQRGWLPAVQG